MTCYLDFPHERHCICNDLPGDPQHGPWCWCEGEANEPESPLPPAHPWGFDDQASE